MYRIKEVIVVEGRYDKNTLSQLVDTVIIETNGFAIFKDGEKAAFLRRLAAERGVIVLTDSDGAGFLIRNHLKGILPPRQVKHAYIPDLAGKERRKRRPGGTGAGPAPGGRDLYRGRRGGAHPGAAHHQGGPVCLWADRRAGRRPAAPPAPKGAGTARTPHGQRAFGGPEPALYPVPVAGENWSHVSRKKFARQRKKHLTNGERCAILLTETRIITD